MGAPSPDGDRLDSPSPDGDRLDRLSRVSASANSRACVSSSDAGSGKGTDMDILLVGSGGREHALAWQLAQSPGCDKLYAAPGHPGIEIHSDSVPVAADDLEGLTAFVRAPANVFVVVGPDAPPVPDPPPSPSP